MIQLSRIHQLGTRRGVRILATLLLCFICTLFFIPLQRHFPSATAATPHLSLPSGPVSKTWYFAEGRVGKGFKELLTLDNPDPTVDCAVTVLYLYTLDGSSTPASKVVHVTVNHATRFTERVNTDLDIQPLQTPATTLSTILTVDASTTPTCKGIVAERPMYFSFHGATSGSDVLGATTLSTTAYFADMQTQGNILSFLTILNPPGGNAANVVSSYYSGGKKVNSQKLLVPSGTRSTLSPNDIVLPQHVAVIITSDQPILVERPSYFSNVTEGNAGTLSSASSLLGVPALTSDMLFAEGYTGGHFQENLVLTNVSGAPINAIVKLEYKNGHTQTLTRSLAALTQTILDVSALATHPTGTCDAHPCTISPEVSAEVIASAGIVTEREMFFIYTHTVNGKTLTTSGGTEATGEDASKAYTTYTFAEGYTNTGYNEWLTLQNPTLNPETIYITLMNGNGRSSTQTFSLASLSRNTYDITQLVAQYLVHAGDNYHAYEVSMTVQAANGAVFAAERPMYWNTAGSSFPTHGGSDIIGYGATITQPATWPAFDGGGQRTGVNTAETTLTSSNVGSLTRLWQQKLSTTADSSPVELPNVTTPAGMKDLLFITTKAGSLLAVDAATGNVLWHQDTQGPNYTTSSPALDPSYQFVYSYGLDGKVHKYAVGSGAEILGNGWPVLITRILNVEKGSSSLNVGSGYLYMTTAGYPGDRGHYEGHIVAVNLATGVSTVFNSLCANIKQLLDANPGDANYCPDVQSGIWSRGGVVLDPVTGNIFITTGNGLYTANTGGHDYGDSVIELSPDLTKIIDTYTPSNYVSLRANDADLGSAAPALLPPQLGSSTPFMAVQAGKDNTLRLLNRQNLSGQGGPNHVGGELQSVSLPQGNDVDTHLAVWNDQNGTTWVFAANDNGLSAFKIVTNAKGQSSLQLAYTNKESGSSPIIANNILFLQSNGVLSAMTPTTGAILWSSAQQSAGGSIGSLHWQSLIVVNGRVYVPDNAGQLTAYGLPHS